VSCHDLRTHQLKNIAQWVRAYRIELDGPLRNSPRIEKPTLMVPEKPSIAVLAFTNLTGDPQPEYSCPWDTRCSDLS